MTSKELKELSTFDNKTADLNGDLLFKENSTNLRLTDYELMKVLDNLNDNMQRKYGLQIQLHCTYAFNGHSKTSYHYKGLAADFSLQPNKMLLFTTQIKNVVAYLREIGYFHKIGFGVYHQWINRGFHLDLRGTNLYWYQENGKYYYFKEIEPLIEYLEAKGY